MSDFFNEAYRRARLRFTTEQWLALAPQQVTEAIYQAMREMDAAAAAGRTSTSTGPDGDAGPEESDENPDP